MKNWLFLTLFKYVWMVILALNICHRRNSQKKNLPTYKQPKAVFCG